MDTDNLIRLNSYDSVMGDLVTDYKLRCWYWFIQNGRVDTFVSSAYYKEHNLYFPHLVLDLPLKFIFTNGGMGAVAIGRNATVVGGNSIAIGNNATVTNSSVLIGL